jgi:hypothetical protein
MAIKANIVIDQGTDFKAVIDVADTSGVVYDLSGYTTSAQMRKNYNSTSATTFGSSHNGVGGAITLVLDNTITSGLEPGRYLYDVEISSGGVVTRVVEGIVTVTPGITRV